MKSAHLFLPLAALLSLAACTTTSNKRDLYSPVKARGPWTERSREMTISGRSDHRSATTVYTVTKRGPQPTAAPVAPAPAPEVSTPIPTAQPPPPAPLPAEPTP